MIDERKIRHWLFWLILLSLAIRGVLAGFLELGNDEVYYWTYALYPDRSHFDHPPMVGWIIQFFTLNLTFQSEFFLRLPSLVLGAVNTWLVFQIGRHIKGSLTGWYAALLFNASLYGFIITGVFILPDTPQMFFWLLSLYLFVLVLPENPSEQKNKVKMLFAGMAVGLAMISKYTAIFLWVGAGLYILLYNRSWFKTGSLYLAALASLLIFSPVIRWNVMNDFVSFTYQGGRAGFFSNGINPVYFLTELGGQVLYNNPVNVALIIVAIIAFFRRNQGVMERSYGRIFLLTALPAIGLFLFLSLFRPTLPHWTGPSYITLLFPTAAYLSVLSLKWPEWRAMPAILFSSLLLLITVVVLGFAQVETGFLYTGKESDPTRRGEHDVSMDMYGWRQIGAEFQDLTRKDTLGPSVADTILPVFSYRWFPAANIDYYVARQAGTYVLAIGPLDRIHKYAWIDEERGGFRIGMSGYYITTSRDFADPSTAVGQYFTTIVPVDTLEITRGGKVAGYAFYYFLGKMKDLPPRELPERLKYIAP